LEAAREKAAKVPAANAIHGHGHGHGHSGDTMQHRNGTGQHEHHEHEHQHNHHHESRYTAEVNAIAKEEEQQSTLSNWLLAEAVLEVGCDALPCR
jgi:hypothetical protein